MTEQDWVKRYRELLVGATIADVEIGVGKNGGTVIKALRLTSRLKVTFIAGDDCDEEVVVLIALGV